MHTIEIFYADDDEDDLMFFREGFENIVNSAKLSVLLHLHNNGIDLIENIKKTKAANAIVLLDINMPMKTGIELLEEIKNEPEIQQFPVIMYSTSSNPSNIEECRKLGADLYVVKPSRFKDLEAMISKFLSFNWKNHQANDHNFVYKA